MIKRHTPKLTLKKTVLKELKSSHLAQVVGGDEKIKCSVFTVTKIPPPPPPK